MGQTFLGNMLPQHMALCVSLFVKKCEATSKQGRRLKFGSHKYKTN